jgi:hypothetical protein
MAGLIKEVISGIGAVGIGEIVFAELKKRRELKTQRMAAGLDAAQKLLERDEWQKRRFDAIKGQIGGFTDDELRKILVRIGAVRLTGNDGTELWGLRSRNYI